MEYMGDMDSMVQGEMDLWTWYLRFSITMSALQPGVNLWSRYNKADTARHSSTTLQYVLKERFAFVIIQLGPGIGSNPSPKVQIKDEH